MIVGRESTATTFNAEMIIPGSETLAKHHLAVCRYFHLGDPGKSGSKKSRGNNLGKLEPAGTSSAMSSAKTKIALVIALVLLLVASAGLVATWQFARHRQSASSLQGFWEGSISVNTATLRLLLKVDKTPDGTYTATLDSVDQGARDIPVNAIMLSNGAVRFQLASLQANYEGDLNARATEMSGKWHQGGMSFPLTFKRTKNPSTIAAPLPSSAYARRESSPLQGVWKGTINAGGIPLRLVVKISETSPGKFTGTMDSLDQGARNIPLTAAEFSKPIARFDIASIDGHYEGTLKDDGSEIEGNWTQVGKDFPCLLKRADLTEDAAPNENAYAFASDADLQGFWNGTLETGPSTLRLVLKIARSTNGTYTAALDSLDQGAKDIHAATVSFNAPNVEVEWPALRASFHGQLEKGKLVGIWQQGPSDFPLELERTNRLTRASAPKGKN
jgi:hypothetical protein